MATFRKRGKTITAIVRRKGVTQTKTFQTKAAAVVWANGIEGSIGTGVGMGQPDKTFRDVLIKYRDEVTTKKVSVDKETARIDAILRDEKWVDTRLGDLTTAAFAEYRDRRLKTVKSSGTTLKPNTVSRELTILSGACTIATKEWKWFVHNPFHGCSHPKPSAHRTRRPSPDELTQIMFCSTYDPYVRPASVRARTGAAVLFAIETGMREGEIAALRWSEINFDSHSLTVAAIENRGGKSAAAAREVGLTEEAERILIQLKPDDPGQFIFGLSADQISNNFRIIRNHALVAGLTFHDLRHEATTRLARYIDIADLARMIGHTDLKSLMIYYNPTGEELSARLRQRITTKNK
jgi:integrase